MSTPTERRIRQARKSASGILLPIMEDLLEQEVIPENEGDFLFLDHLVRRRAMKREKGVFSPSMLGSCMRQAYFAKTGQEQRRVASPTKNGYFLQGNFFHLKWQFALHRAEERGLLELAPDNQEWPAAHGCELRVYSTVADFAGTVDAIVKINGVWYLIDFKGINLNDFKKAQRDGAKLSYRVQIAGYAMIINGNDQLPLVIKNCLLISENKPGPMSGGNPLALHEQIVSVADHKAEVQKRLKELRKHEKKRLIPEPACVSTRHIQFQECPYYWFCKTEVRAIQREREYAADRNPKQPTLALPQREGLDSTRRARVKRKGNPS